MPTTDDTSPQQTLRQWHQDPRYRPAPGQPGSLYQQLAIALGPALASKTRPRRRTARARIGSLMRKLADRIDPR